MLTDRIDIPNDGVPVSIPFKETGSYGTEIALYNSSDTDLALCGSKNDADKAWRGFKAGAAIFLPLDPKEPAFVVNNGAAPVTVDWMVTK